MYLEHRKSFRWVVGLLSFALASALCLFLGQLQAPGSLTSVLALLLLSVGAVVGFERMLTLFLPLVLAKLWPSLESERI